MKDWIRAYENLVEVLQTDLPVIPPETCPYINTAQYHLHDVVSECQRIQVAVLNGDYSDLKRDSIDAMDAAEKAISDFEDIRELNSQLRQGYYEIRSCLKEARKQLRELEEKLDQLKEEESECS